MTDGGTALVLETARLRLRRFSIADAAFVLRLLNEPSFIQHIGDRGVRTLDDAAGYIERGPIASYRRSGFGLYAVDLKDGTTIGACGVLKRDELDDVDLGYSLLPEFWSQGFAVEAAAAVKHYARDMLGLRRLAAIVAHGNEASARLLDKLGFSFDRVVRLRPDAEELRLFTCTLREDLMPTDAMPTPDLYFDTILAFQRSSALKSAIELDLFTAISDGARTPAALAKATGAQERGLRILSDYLTTIGFLTKTVDSYDLTPESAFFLSKKSPAYLGGTAAFLHSGVLIGQYEHLTETIRRGTPPLNMVADDNPAWVEFAHAMVPMMMPTAHAIAELPGVSSGGPMRVLDIAAGHGIFGIVIAQRNPQAEIVAVDWPQVLEVASANARAMGVGSRHKTLPGDAFKVEYGTGFNLVLVTNFLHHFDRPTNVAFLKKTHSALETGGRVVVLEFVPNDDRVSPPMAARFSLTMLAGTPGGDAYTFAELRDMLTEAGFTGVTAHPLQGPQTVVIGVK